MAVTGLWHARALAARALDGLWWWEWIWADAWFWLCVFRLPLPSMSSP